MIINIHRSTIVFSVNSPTAISTLLGIALACSRISPAVCCHELAVAPTIPSPANCRRFYRSARLFRRAERLPPRSMRCRSRQPVTSGSCGFPARSVWQSSSVRRKRRWSRARTMERIVDRVTGGFLKYIFPYSTNDGTIHTNWSLMTYYLVFLCYVDCSAYIRRILSIKTRLYFLYICVYISFFFTKRTNHS